MIIVWVELILEEEKKCNNYYLLENDTHTHELRLISNIVESIKEGVTETRLSKIPYDHFVPKITEVTFPGKNRSIFADEDSDV